MYQNYSKFSAALLLLAVWAPNAALASPAEGAVHSKKEVADHFLGCVKSLKERTSEASLACLNTVAGDLGQFDRFTRRDSILLSGFAFVKGVLFLAEDDPQRAGREWLKSEKLETSTGFGILYTNNWDCIKAVSREVHFELAVAVAQVALNRYDSRAYAEYTAWPAQPTCPTEK